MDKKKVGNFISELRQEKGLTQRKLADRLFLTDKAVSKWETGSASPDTSVLVSLSQVLGVTVTELINGQRTKFFSEQAAESVIIETLETFQKEKRHISKCEIKKVLILIILLIIFLSGIIWAGVQANEYEEIHSHVLYVESQFAPYDYEKGLKAFNGEMDTTAYVLTYKSIYSLKWAALNYPEAIKKKTDKYEDLFVIYGQINDNLNGLMEIFRYNSIEGNKVIFGDEKTAKLIQTVDSLNEAHTALNEETNRLWERYKDNLFVKIYIYIS